MHRTLSRRRAIALGFAALPFAGRFPARASGGAWEPLIRVSSKIDTEGALLGGLILLALRRGGLAVEDRLALGPTRIVRAALLAGEVDIYPEYTGNGAFFLGPENDPAWKDAAAGYAKVREGDARNGLAWLRPGPANNTWAIAVRRDLAVAEGLATLDDLARLLARGGRLRLAASAEFVESPAALPAFQAAYGFALTGAQLLVLSGGDTAATIRAAANGTSGVNAAMAYGTDGALKALGLIVLADVRGVQPVYAPAAVVRTAVLERFPAIAGMLEPAFARLTLERLQAFNARIAVEGEDAAVVARDALDGVG